MTPSNRRILLLAAFLALWIRRAPAESNWPQFRGPAGDGKSNAVGLPLTWSEKDNVRWKTRIHDKGWSSPVVWGDQVWLTTATEDGHQMFVLCTDRNTGKVLLDKKLYDIARPGFCPSMNSYASPTPVIEAGRVYVHFGSYGTACLDTSTFDILWERRDLECNHWRGPGSSPILFDNLLILTFDGYDYQYLVALDKKTGQTVWRRDRNIEYGHDDGDQKKAYSTPGLFELGGRLQLVSPSAGATQAFDPRTGEELWRVTHGGMNAAARPVAGHGLVFVNSALGNYKVFAVRADGAGEVSQSHVEWKFTKGTPTRPSHLLVDDLVYLISDTGVATAIEARTAKVVWTQRIPGNYSASPLYAEGRIYFFSEEGVTTVIRAGRNYEVLATNQLEDGFMASPAVSGKTLLLRSKTHLYGLEQ
jgi:outer membrane protein assembly factor BamB